MSYLRVGPMLPILPAILLLLLHGPSNLERLSREGRLPAEFEALRREAAMATPAPAQRRAVMVALMTGTDPVLANALIGLLEADEPPVTEADDAPAPRFVLAPEPSRRPLADGFAEGRRTRDGPFAIA